MLHIVKTQSLGSVPSVSSINWQTECQAHFKWVIRALRQLPMQNILECRQVAFGLEYTLAEAPKLNHCALQDSLRFTKIYFASNILLKIYRDLVG